ncbi:MAG: hypothetical protein K6T80_02985 [Firmicutes bacterium]|nr:hypothetical protein [Bacillota bacterium]
MFFRKITSRKKGKEYNYLKLIENYRDGNKIKQRVVANLGSLDDLTPEKVQGLISGLARICGIPGTGNLKAQKVLSHGEVLAIHKIWEILNLEEAVNRALSGQKADESIPLCLELMVLNQVIRPGDIKALDEWCRCLYLPRLEGRELSPGQFHKALETVTAVKDELERHLYKRLAETMPLQTDPSFILVTSAVLEPTPRRGLNLSPYGRYLLDEPEEVNKVDLLVAADREGLPYAHRVLSKAMDIAEMEDMVRRLRDNFGVARCLFAGESGTGAGNKLSLARAGGFEYVIGRKPKPGRDRALLQELSPDGKGYQASAENVLFKEIKHGGTRHLLCLNRQVAGQVNDALDEQVRLIELELRAIQREMAGNRSKNAVYGKNAPVLQDRACRRFFEWNFDRSKGEFTYRLKEDLLLQEKKMAGHYVIETNTGAMGAKELLHTFARTLELADNFRVVKNFTDKPGHLFNVQNIAGSVFVSFLAAVVEKTLEKIINSAGVRLTSRQALELLEEIKVTINLIDGREVKTVTRTEQIHDDILSAVGVSSLKRTIV